MDPFTALIASIYASAGLFTSSATALAVASYATSTLISAFAISVLRGSQSSNAANNRAQLSAPTDKPLVRHVYGVDRAQGSRAGVRVANNSEHLYGCWILNSRPSDLTGTVRLFIDDREIGFTGDPFDLTGNGARTSDVPLSGDDGFCRFWIGRGDQTSPPDYFLNNGRIIDADWWTTSDAWQGLTVLWAFCDAGNAERFRERWKNYPPDFKVEGRYSKVWDPSDPAQSLDDPSTWEWSENHRLCLLDMVTQNPYRPRTEDTLDLPSWITAANAADVLVPTATAGNEMRYRAAGTVIYGPGEELATKLNAMALSGAADWIDIGGRLGVTPGIWEAPILTVTEVLKPEFTFSDMKAEDQLYNTFRASYLSPERGYVIAELEDWSPDGAVAADGGQPKRTNIDMEFCPSAPQAMRVRKITALRMRRQDELTATLPPEAIQAVGGSNITLDLPAPYSAFDGAYEVQRIAPAADLEGADGVAMRLPATLIGTTADIYAWDPPTEEETIIEEDYTEQVFGLLPPTDLIVRSGDATTSGNVQAQGRIAFTASASGAAFVSRYEVQVRVDDGVWQSASNIPPDAVIDDAGDPDNGKVSGFFFVITLDGQHDVRVRAVSNGDAWFSDWVQFNNFVYDLDVTVNSTAGGVGEFQANVTVPNPNLVYGLRIYRGPVGGGIGAADLLQFIFNLPQGASDIVARVGQGFPVDATVTFDPLNQVTGGDFSNPADWTATNNWSVASGVATHTPGVGTSTLTQDIAPPDTGATVRVSYTQTRVAGASRVSLIGSVNTTGMSDNQNGDGFITFDLVAADHSADSTVQLEINATQNFDGSVLDDIAVYYPTGAELDNGEYDFWIVPVSISVVEGTPQGPFTTTIR